LIDGIDKSIVFDCSGTSINLEVCYDSDKGFDYYTKGVVTINNYSIGVDQCLDGKGALLEYFCYSNSTQDYIIYNCPYGCNNGVCIPYNIDSSNETEDLNIDSLNETENFSVFY
jgi:hypothetical protein